MRLVGVDGCRAGWVAVACDIADPYVPALSAPIFSIERSFQALLAEFEGQRALMAVDIPIGLPSGVPRDCGRRRADDEARRFLGPRRGVSVFSAPCRPTLTATTYRAACDLEVQARGAVKGLSQQAYRITPKIREVDEALTPAHQEPVGSGADVWVREVHPEVTFAMLAGAGQGGYGLVHSKRSCKACRGQDCPGERDRLALLCPYLPDFEPPAVHARLLHEYPRQPGESGPAVGRDDIVDAVACLVTALRIVRGEAVTLPAGAPEYDARRLRMEIVA